MNIVVSKKLQQQLSAADSAVRQSFAKAVAILGGHSKDHLPSSVSKVEATDPEIYVLKEGPVRYFFAFQDEDLVLLGLTTRESGKPDLRYVDRFRLMPKGVQQSEVDSKIADSNFQLIDSEEASGAMADTNAFGWYVDDYHIEEIDIHEDEIRVSLSWHATGDQDEDRSWHGHEMTGTANAVIDQDGDVTYEDVTAEVIDSYDDHDRDE